MLEDRGFDELNSWDSEGTSLVGLLPGHDAVHLGWVLAKGYTPTEGEVLFAGIDVAFTTWDLATLGGGAVASSTASTGLKTTAREGFREGMKTIGENLAKTAAKTELKEGSAARDGSVACPTSQVPQSSLGGRAEGTLQDVVCCGIRTSYCGHEANTD